MFDEFVSALRQQILGRLFLANPTLTRRRFRRSGSINVEQLEIRRMLTAPTISVPTTIDFVGTGSLAFTGANAITVSDTPGSTDSFTIVVQNGTASFGSTSGLSVNGNGTNSLSVVGSLSALNADLSTLVYTPFPGFAGSSFLWIYAGNTSTNQQSNVTVTANVNLQDVIPTLNLPSSVSIIEGSSGGITSGTLSDVDGSTELFSAIVNNGTLSFGTTDGLTIYGNGTGTVVATGSLSAFSQALPTMTYVPNTNFTGMDTAVMDVVNTGNDHASSGIVIITVPPNHVAPTISAPTTVNVTKDGGTPFVQANSIQVTDAYGAVDQYSIVAQHGTLTFGSTTGLTVYGNGTETVIVTGPQTAVNSALAGLVYAPDAGFVGTDTVGMAVANVGDSLVGYIQVNFITTTNVVAPTLPTFTDITYLSGAEVRFAGITVSDNTNSTEDFSIVVQHGTLTFGSTAGLTVYGDGTGTVVAIGSPSALNAALKTLEYVRDPGYVPPDTYSVYVENQDDNLSTSAAARILIITHV